MRILALVLSLVFMASAGQAQQFRVAHAGCVNPGQQITLQGNFGTAQVGPILVNLGAQYVPMQVRRWSPAQVKVVVPRRGVRDGSTYGVKWDNPSMPTLIGNITICDRNRGKTARAPRDVVPAPDGSPEYILVVSNGQSRAASKALTDRGATLLRTRSMPQVGQVVMAFSFPGSLSLEEARAALSTAAPAAELDLHHIYGFAAGPRLFAAEMIGDSPGGCRLRGAVRIGMIDGPVDASHPALRGVSVVRKSVLSSNTRSVGADHGTSVAALMAGNPGAEGLAGFAVGAKLYAASAFSTTKGRQGARTEDVLAGLDWLMSQRVRLINMSMAGSPNRVMAKVLSAARQKGVVVVAAAGNNGSSKPYYPAASPDTIAVTAVDASGRAYRKANRGAHIDFAAPGVDLYIAKGKGGSYGSGTSYAAPIVTAILARSGKLSLSSARAKLRQSASDLGPAGRDTKFGYGLVKGGC